MEKKYLAVVLMAVFASSAFAQDVTTNEDDNVLSSVYLRYSPGAFTPNKGKSQSFDGFSVGYIGYVRLSKHIPLFLEGDFSIQYSSYSKNSNDFSMFSSNLAMGVGYGFDIPKTPISVIPKVGLDLGCLLYAHVKGNGKNINLRSIDDMGSSDATWNDYLFGGHIGVDFKMWNHLLVGFSYQYYLTPIAKDLYVQQANISVGYCF